VVLAAAGVAFGPLAYGAVALVYPGAFTGLLSSQTSQVLAPAPQAPPSSSKRSPRRHGRAAPAPPTASGVQLLPGRLDQLRAAIRISHQAGPGVLLLGRGFGAAHLDPSITDPNSVPLPQRTGPTWVGRVLTECGWLGIAAFAGLLVWLVAVGVAAARAGSPFGPALPFVALVTAAGALETTILDVRAFSLPFWIVAGLASGATGLPSLAVNFGKHVLRLDAAAGG